jgi:glutamate/aspartate transport system permease protein
MNYHWNWGVLLEESPTGEGSYLSLLINGAEWTIATATASWMLAMAIGVIVGVMRVYPSTFLRAASRCYVELFRNIPLLVQLFLWFFVLPELLPQTLAAVLKQSPQAPFYTAVVGIGIYMSARIAEQVRSGIQALPRGQYMAGSALGLKPMQCFVYILLPMALRIILPPLTTDIMNTVKATSIALTIGLMELTAQARAVADFSFQVFEPFLIAIAVYVLINLIVVFVMGWVEQKLRIPGYMGAR